MGLKSLLLDHLPRGAQRQILAWNARRKGRNFYEGGYQNWEQAMRAATGYDSTHIFEKTRASLRLVRDGSAVFERDSVLMDEPEVPFALLSCLLQAALSSGGKLHVLDFGGSLGSSYFQCRAHLTAVGDLRWSVVEQAQYVEWGREEFQTDQLRFYKTVDECLAHEQPNLMLLSSTVQYLENPWELLGQVAGLPIPFRVIDRVPLVSGGEDRLTVQHVPPVIYEASYPAWIFGEDKFRRWLTENHTVLADYPAVDGFTRLDDRMARFRGFFLMRRHDSTAI